MTASSSSTSFIRRLLGADRDSDQFTVTFRPLPRSSKLRRTAHAAVQKRIPSSICKMLEDENTRRRTIRLQRAKDAEQSLIALARRQLAQGLSPEQVLTILKIIERLLIGASYTYDPVIDTQSYIIHMQ